MIEVKIVLDDIDYDQLVEWIAPLVAEKLEAKGGVLGLLGRNREGMTGVARQLLKTMSQEKRDEFLLQLLEEKKGLILQKANEKSQKEGLGVKAISLTAKKI